jgi:hypothetical protein
VLRRMLGRLGAICVLVGAVTTALAPSALAADPGRWIETGRKTTSVSYWQGITFDAGARNFYFDGVSTGLYRTNDSLARTGGVSNVIPSSVKSAEGYNHLGDLSFDAGAERRVLLPLECYYPGQPNGGNTCRTGSIAVAAPGTLSWRYYVKLDPAYIKKAMWVEASPDGRWIWTSSGTTLLAYNAAELAPANAAPAGRKLVPQRLTGALPASGVSGATFYGGRLFLALNRGTYFEVISYAIDTSGPSPVLVDGPRREIERTKSSSLYETEGLATATALNGELHWQIQPQTPFYGRIISFRPTS